jgi:hypothetical protein
VNQHFSFDLQPLLSITLSRLRANNSSFLVLLMPKNSWKSLHQRYHIYCSNFIITPLIDFTLLKQHSVDHWCCSFIFLILPSMTLTIRSLLLFSFDHSNLRYAILTYFLIGVGSRLRFFQALLIINLFFSALRSNFFSCFISELSLKFKPTSNHLFLLLIKIGLG